MRILVWNIQNFTLKRLNDNVSGNTTVEKAAVAEGNLANLLYILSTVEQADADVFVVLEALCDKGVVGGLVAGDGAQGLVYLLSQLREFNAQQWSLVPPLRVNSIIRRIETVGVFYRADRVDFRGPNVRQGPYPEPWSDCVFPQNTTAAAQCIFYKQNSQSEITFPEAKNRRPFLTTFYETATQRTIKLFSVHTQPGVNARRAMSSMLDIPNWAPGNMEVTVFAGDFNVDLLQPNTLESSTLSSFRTAGLTRLAFPQEPNQKPRSVYIARMYATPIVGERVYDQRGSKGRVSYLKPELLDYGFVGYGTNATPPGNAYGAQMVDRVAGVTAVGVLPALSTDMGWGLPTIQAIQDMIPTIAPPPNGAKRVNGVTTITTTTPHGFEPGDLVHLTYLDDLSFWMHGPVERVLSQTTFTVAEPKKPDGTSGNGQAAFYYRNKVFRQRWNYWHIGPPVADSGTGTSDHLPVLMVV